MSGIISPPFKGYDYSRTLSGTGELIPAVAGKRIECILGVQQYSAGTTTIRIVQHGSNIDHSFYSNAAVGINVPMLFPGVS